MDKYATGYEVSCLKMPKTNNAGTKKKEIFQKKKNEQSYNYIEALAACEWLATAVKRQSRK